MYKVRPKGINIKDNERNVSDGFLQESINLQWKDNSYKPIPERLTTISGINQFATREKIIAHKVSDEDQINILTFGSNGKLAWFAKLINGEYVSHSIILINEFPIVTDFDSLSFTILNGLVYFMSASQEFYYRLQYNEIEDAYELKDMYAWKSLIPFFPTTTVFKGTLAKGDDNLLIFSKCGLILIRFTLVLTTGEEVLHSPIYPYSMYGLNKSDSAIPEEELITNIHTLINTNFDFSDTPLLDEEISAINIYSSVASYKTEVGPLTPPLSPSFRIQFTEEDEKAEVQRLSELPFYLIRTLDKPSVDTSENNIFIFVGNIDPNLKYNNNNFKVNADTIAAGTIMPEDNFSYHKVYGALNSYNGRLIISNPKTVLSNGHMRALGVKKSASQVGYYIGTEDGDFKGVGYREDTDIDVRPTGVISRGVLSYPDGRANYVGGNQVVGSSVNLYKIRANTSHNISCAFTFNSIISSLFIYSSDETEFEIGISPSEGIFYGEPDKLEDPSNVSPLFYTSDNRVQFSSFGEYSVWPAINSYRVGEGRIIFTSSNNIDPSNSDYISPLFIGTSDGIYTVNFDVTGAQLIQSITKAAELPALSNKNVLIEQNLIYVSDKGLIVINSGNPVNITEKYFPEYGGGNLPENNSVYPNYNLLVDGSLSGDYKVTDIIDYMKGSLLAFDSRRNNIWCSNPNADFSLIFNLVSNQWSKSTYVFTEVISFAASLKNNGDEIYSRYLVRSKESDPSTLDILSGENEDEEVVVHLLTRGIKIFNADQYKKIQRLISRCELYRKDSNGNFTFGLWGKQDLNKDKLNIPLVAYSDNSSNAWPDNIRQDIPVGRMKGKYKIITILQGGKILPKSSIDNFEIVAMPVENNILR